MCFRFRKKVLKGQEDILARLEKLSGGEIDTRLDKLAQTADANREIIVTSMRLSNDALISGIRATNDTVLQNVKGISEQNAEKLTEVKTALDKNLAEIRGNIDKSLKEVREDNEKQLGSMRSMMENKLDTTLNERLGQAFTAINERLDAVNKGLGEMQSLSLGVTDLNKVLSNIKTRGTWGEVSLENLLEGILTKEQYVRQQNVSGKRNGTAVDFAVVLPGKGEGKIYLPIDVKFPVEDYQRLVAASEGGDVNAHQAAVRGLERAVKIQAKSISEKYINPPHTTDFAIMYLPIEGLYAEVVRNPGLIEELQSKFKVIPSGPTTVAALLNSLQMGFRSLAIQKSSKDVFRLLTQFKADFGKFVEYLDQAQSQVDKVSKSLENATKRTGTIQKKLDKVEGLRIEEDVELSPVLYLDEETGNV